MVSSEKPNHTFVVEYFCLHAVVLVKEFTCFLKVLTAFVKSIKRKKSHGILRHGNSKVWVTGRQEYLSTSDCIYKEYGSDFVLSQPDTNDAHVVQGRRTEKSKPLIFCSLESLVISYNSGLPPS